MYIQSRVPPCPLLFFASFLIVLHYLPIQSLFQSCRPPYELHTQVLQSAILAKRWTSNSIYKTAAVSVRGK